MEQLEKLKALICHLIDNNQFILSSLKCIKQRGDLLPIIELSYLESCYISKPSKILISVQDLKDFYHLAKLCDIEQDGKLVINNLAYMNNHFHSEIFREIAVKMPMTKSECDIIEKKIKGFVFLNGGTTSIHQALTAYSLAYSLYHEIGHAFHNKYIPETAPCKREFAADVFAFEGAKALCDGEDKDVLFLGTFIGVTHVFCKLSYIQEISDEKHPYTIERLCKLLDFWDLNDDSPFWDLTCNIVKRWCEKNNLSMEWDNDIINSKRDKFIEAYKLFRRNV